MLYEFYFFRTNNTIINSEVVRDLYIDLLQHDHESVEDYSLNEFLVNDSVLWDYDLYRLSGVVGIDADTPETETLFFSNTDEHVYTETALKKKYCELFMNNVLDRDTCFSDFVYDHMDCYIIDNSEIIIPELKEEVATR